MSRTSKRGLLGHFEGEVKYFETQTELLATHLASYVSHRQSQLYEQKRKWVALEVFTAFVFRLALAQDGPDVDAEAAEIGVFSYSHDVNMVLLQMQKTLATLLMALADLGRTLECEALVIEEAKEGLKSHLASCKEAVGVVVSSKIMADASTKAALALLVHRPLLFRVKTQSLADFHALLEATNK